MTTEYKALNDTFYIAPQITKDDFSAFKEAGITLLINNRPDAEEPGILSVADAQSLAEENGITYLHLPMSGGQPLAENILPDMQAALAKQQKEGGKTLAHCRSGTRSSFLWGSIQILEGKSSAEEVVQTAIKAGINLSSFMPVLTHFENSAIE